MISIALHNRAYFDAAQSSAENTKPSEFVTLKLYIINWFKNIKIFSFSNFLQKRLDILVLKLQNNVVALSLEFEVLKDRITKETETIENSKELYIIIQKSIDAITFTDEFFSKVDYFDNEILKIELKKCLVNSYQIEVALKKQVYLNQPRKKEPSELSTLLANKNKQSLLAQL